MAPAKKRQRLEKAERSNVVVDTVHDVATVDVPNITKDAMDDHSKPQEEESKSQQTTSSLFVRSLPASTTSESLAELFSDLYPIKHAVAVSDPATKACRGYGFVTFADPEDAIKAKASLNGKVIDRKKIRIELAEARDREHAGGKNERKAQREKERLEAQEPPKLIVRNLPWTIKRQDQLAALFQKYGKIKQAYIPKRSGGLLPGFGFVIMRSRKHAEKAIEGENGKDVDGRTIAVDWAVKKEVFARLNGVDDKQADVMLDGAEGDDAVSGAGLSPGRDAHVDSDAEETDDHDNSGVAINENVSGSEDEEVGKDEGEELENDHGQDLTEDRSATLFVRNLPFSCTDEDLEDHFSMFGSVRYARVVIDSATDRSKGTGFVCFYREQDADSCYLSAPSRIPSVQHAGTKDAKSAVNNNSILQNTDVDGTGNYTLDGRVLQVSRAVDKSEANKFTQDGIDHRYRRDKDKRRLYLLSEGTLDSRSKLWQSLPPHEQTMRHASLKQRKSLIEHNPSLHLSLTRLSVRNIPRTIDSKQLKAMAREAIVGFATDVKNGKRQKLSDEELNRGGDEMKAAERARKEAGKGLVKQAKVVFEAEGGSKVSEDSGAGRSRGYGFIEYHTHRCALMGLRWLNGQTIDYRVKDPEAHIDREALQDRKKRLIVEFAIENVQVVSRRKERELKLKDQKQDRGEEQKAGLPKHKSKPLQKKRKNGDNDAEEKDNSNDDHQHAVDEKTAQRNRIIGRKRMLRRDRRGQKK